MEYVDDIADRRTGTPTCGGVNQSGIQQRGIRDVDSTDHDRPGGRLCHAIRGEGSEPATPHRRVGLRAGRRLGTRRRRHGVPAASPTGSRRARRQSRPARERPLRPDDRRGSPSADRDLFAAGSGRACQAGRPRRGGRDVARQSAPGDPPARRRGPATDDHPDRRIAAASRFRPRLHRFPSRDHGPLP